MSPDIKPEQAGIQSKTGRKDQYLRAAMLCAALAVGITDRSPNVSSANRVEASSSQGKVDPAFWSSLPTRAKDGLNDLSLYNLGVVISGPTPDQLTQDFLDSGWQVPDKYLSSKLPEIVLAMANLACKDTPYPAAPLTLMKVYDQLPTLGFVKQNKKPAQREEARIWQSPNTDPETDKPLYLVSVVQDVDLVRPSSKTFCRTKLIALHALPERIINPDVDQARQNLEDQFRATKQLVNAKLVPGTKPYSATIDKYNSFQTDGQRDKLTLRG